VLFNITISAFADISKGVHMLITANPRTIDLQAKLFRGFADPSRLAILNTLRTGPLTVSEIVQATGLTQSNVSNHLGCLRDCGLVTAQQQGRYAFYSVSDERVDQLLRLADDLLASVAQGVYECTRYAGQSSEPHKMDEA
jgi:ArsR family transcriptional regulator, cadmium/lead-responsive transcriptional repressor